MRLLTIAGIALLVFSHASCMTYSPASNTDETEDTNASSSESQTEYPRKAVPADPTAKIIDDPFSSDVEIVGPWFGTTHIPMHTWISHRLVSRVSRDDRSVQHSLKISVVYTGDPVGDSLALQWRTYDSAYALGGVPLDMAYVDRSAGCNDFSCGYTEHYEMAIATTTEDQFSIEPIQFQLRSETDQRLESEVFQEQIEIQLKALRSTLETLVN